MEYLDPFPEIVALGRPILQHLANEWLSSPVARECGVNHVLIAPDATGFADVGLYDETLPGHGEAMHFPADNLLRFIIERALPPERRPELLARLVELRRKAGPLMFQRYRVNRKPRA